MEIEDITALNIPYSARIEIDFHPLKIDRKTGKVFPDLENLVTHFGIFNGLIEGNRQPLLHYYRSLWEGNQSQGHVEDYRQRIDYMTSIKILKSDTE
jgi:hypothetical protein